MSYHVIWHERATNTAVRFLKDDPEGLRQVYAAADQLADDPRPIGTTAYGSPELRRMHIGRYRLLYEIDEGTITIIVLNIGRVP
ncbi:type II toxin-antitoxin system RelE/ParE family toxin [Streptomyces sp. SID8379]|uniref:type II toxin-antitoxin system RelE family toxin n=1 Tax=unclassified Streptomyces TaxID=2593676 RepID=UPI00036CD866|nr:type II toxin-antitoxin system RelE/ParE family toxin [Streptomyces sp. HmicA12]MYW69167.1 type II toxin-antitoxin system RelE/ParE family toxin [Streptomyces sp. SID8379]